MIRNFFLTCVFLTSVFATSLHAFNWNDCCYSDCCCDTLGTGFLIGAYGAFDIFCFHGEDQVEVVPEDDAQLFQDFDVIHRAPGGGGFIGYGFCFCDRFVNAFKAAVTGYGSSAKHTTFFNLENFSQFNTWQLRYIVDLTWEPGMLIGDCLLMYFKFGASYASVRHTLTVGSFNEFPLVILDKDKQNHHEWGFVFGSGANVSISRCLSVFGEYIWHSYPFSGSASTSVSDPDIDFHSRTTRLFGSGFRAGLMYQF